DEPILEHSDAFRENVTYGMVYEKTNAILNMLNYVVGDSVFRAIMRKYTRDFRLEHPSSEDFIDVCQKISGMRLDWFFYEWLRTNYTCDYAVKCLSSVPDTDGYKTTIALANEGKAAMPVDLLLTYADGSRQTAIIPIGWKAKKEQGAIVLPQWALYVSSYQTTFATPKKVVSAYIDTSLYMQDIDRLNNESGFFPPVQFGFLSQYSAYAPLAAYGVGIVPRLWYGAQQGMKVGASLDGSSVFARNISHAGFYYNTQSRSADWWLEYHAPVAPLLDIFGSAEQEYGIRELTVGAEKKFRSMLASPVEHTLHFQVRYTDSYTDSYPFYDLLWNKGELNTAKLSYVFSYNAKCHLRVTAEYEAALTRQTGFVHSRIDITGSQPFSSLIDGSFRVMEGTSGGAVPVQKRFYLAGASPEEQFDNTLYRDIAGVSMPLDTSGHILLPGGGDLPGYANQYVAASGRTMLAASVKLTANLLRGTHNVSISGFGGVGYVSEYTLPDFSGMSVPYFDAGVSVRYAFVGGDGDLLRSLLVTQAPLQIELSFPFFVSQPLPGDAQVKMRWVVGVSSEL
ncbi:MAG TPA: M1 family aminopeptidase, partial [Candidatus Kapabacteria bacterium]|nr:M1 family aminopeptidase [Candidatus Kapabacteria bacterium]